MACSRRLIINADDYGRSSEVNLAIEELALAGRLGGISILANGLVSEGAADFLRRHPRLSAGVHFNAVEGKPLSNAVHGILTGPEGDLAGLGEIVRRWLLRPGEVGRAVEIEWRSQIERLLDHGVHLTHADSHQHLHAFPAAFEIAARLAREYSIPALRWPRERSAVPLRRAVSTMLRGSLAIARVVSSHNDLVHNDHFLGFRRVGGYGLPEVLADLGDLRNGLTELAIHPSLTDHSPYTALNGDLERRAILNESLPAEINRLGVTLVSWSDVGPRRADQSARGHAAGSGAHV
jgi:chitin disaccharide deacetylase